MLRSTKIANELAIIERKLQETSNQTLKDALKKKQARLKDELNDAKKSTPQLAKKLLAERQQVKSLSKIDFNDLVRRLSKKPEYSFLKTMSKSTVRTDIERMAKPVGWRFKGRGNYDKPTKVEIAKGKKSGSVYREARPIRSDVSQVVRLGEGGVVINGISINVGDKGAYGRSKEQITITGITPKIINFTTSEGKKKGIYRDAFAKSYVPNGSKKNSDIQEVETKQNPKPVTKAPTFKSKALEELKEWKKEKMQDIKDMAKYLGINSQHRDYIKVSDKLDYLIEDAAKIIKSNLLKDGKYTMWKTFKVKSYKGDMYAESYLSLTKYIAYEHPNFEKDFKEFNKQYPYSTKDDFTKEFIGRLTIPILGYKLCDYTKLGFMMPGAVGGARNNQFAKGGSIGNKMEHGGSIEIGDRVKASKEYGGKSGKVIDKRGSYVVVEYSNGDSDSYHESDLVKKMEHGGSILTEEQEEAFNEWKNDGNVAEAGNDVYTTQDAQWSNRINGIDNLKKYFYNEFLKN